jgi:DNA-binding IclR family transcriptional regulator
LVPLVVPYEDSPPELRILNMVSAGLLFEGRSGNAEELGMTKVEFTRALRSLRTNGAVYIDSSGRYRLGFNTSNFPNVASK